MLVVQDNETGRPRSPSADSSDPGSDAAPQRDLGDGLRDGKLRGDQDGSAPLSAAGSAALTAPTTGSRSAGARSIAWGQDRAFHNYRKAGQGNDYVP